MWFNTTVFQRRKSYGFGSTWGLVKDGKMIFFGWTILLNMKLMDHSPFCYEWQGKSSLFSLWHCFPFFFPHALSLLLYDRVWGVIGVFLTFRAVHAMEPWETVTYSWHTLSVTMTVAGTLLHRVCKKNETFLKKATLMVMTAVTTTSNSHLVFSFTASFRSLSLSHTFSVPSSTPALSGGLWSLLIQPIQTASHTISLAMSNITAMKVGHITVD